MTLNVEGGPWEQPFIPSILFFVGLAYQGKKDIVVFRFILEYSSLRAFGPY
jgi:hypothetical protein